MSPIYVVASTNEELLQDPHLRIHVSTSLCLRLLCKIHVSGFMSQHPCVSQGPLQDPCCRIHSSAPICISGSSTRSTSSDSCLSIFVSHGFSARSTSTSPDSCLSIVISQDPLHVSASTNLDPLQDPRLWAHVSASLYLRLFCKIHVSGSVYKHPYVSQDPLQDPCPRIHVLAFMSQHPFISQDPLQDPCLRSLSIFVSQDSLQDPCLRIHVSASTNMDPLQDPRLWAHVSASLYLRLLCKSHVSGSVCLSFHMYLRVLCKIHVSGSVYTSMSSGSCLSIFESQDPLQDPCVRFMS